ncbi:hypothetical protein [Aquabacterium sp. CECT 9606]|uniref:hypothetical protein n=1 Tax=Aquabacterium sp. CECT 9606 TaxID=2845822 RepID=UPI001E3DB575|nr:hypothetical protein [Aquabacterium sp. CECT 9606]CAH0355133.1 hypothetical protein AQB9606_04189 [Aquabacterium sp. CECT 9606]
MAFCKLGAALLAASCSVLATVAGLACASPARPAREPATSDPAVAGRLLDSTAELTIRRLPTCEVAINTRVSEWKASASIACRKAPASSEACVAALLTARAEQLKQIRSCRSL